MEAPLGLDRPLVSFDPRRVPVYRFDVVVLGSGLAGGVAALTTARAGRSVAVVTKASVGEGNTRYAQGGLAAVGAAEDSFELHVADTLRVGCGLCDPAVVERIVRGAPEAVAELVDLGAEFDRDAEGCLRLSREGGHSRARVVHARGDATGLEIQRTVSAALAADPAITVFPETFAVDLLTDERGDVSGVVGHTATGERVAFCAPDVLLATGGSGQIYRETTNPPVATGDGVAMAFRAGALLRDLEFVQFHPTCLYIAGAARVLISEVLRGAGGVLRDRHGRRFMPDAHPDAELAPRDAVSRAVFRTMVETGDTNVYLDLSDVDADPHGAFPGISRVCKAFGIDIASDPIPVRPGAHYQIGGVATDPEGRASVEGLWAVGECASTGLHGANRMGSNSLLEALVGGIETGRALALRPASAPQPVAVEAGGRSRRPDSGLTQPVNIEDLTYSLKSMMWRQMGVERDAEGMGEAAGKLGFWSRVVQDLAEPGPRTWELVNMLTLARLATLAALGREESRGVHYRTDHPAAGGAHRTLLVGSWPREGPSRVQITREPLATVPTADAGTVGLPSPGSAGR
ncbi:MAG: L-aspartate oxidase [Planctomycetota bacterium]|jgi:L-aspartate oxidase|nr:L-aspartate oxidase [Planctomycetota bacterium]MDP6990061.1 L-aspartate oxidase [Planctomycetota bacterium]